MSNLYSFHPSKECRQSWKRVLLRFYYNSLRKPSNDYSDYTPKISSIMMRDRIGYRCRDLNGVTYLETIPEEREFEELLDSMFDDSATSELDHLGREAWLNPGEKETLFALPAPTFSHWLISPYSSSDSDDSEDERFVKRKLVRSASVSTLFTKLPRGKSLKGWKSQKFNTDKNKLSSHEPKDLKFLLRESLKLSPKTTQSSENKCLQFLDSAFKQSNHPLRTILASNQR